MSLKKNSNDKRDGNVLIYSAPRLVKFGSVRNLTGGGSIGNMQDGQATMLMVN